jgi:hypothetical protein
MNSEGRKNGVGVIRLSPKELRTRDEQLLALISGHVERGGGALRIDYSYDTKTKSILVKVSIYDKIIFNGIYHSEPEPQVTFDAEGDYNKASVDMKITINFTTRELRFKGKMCLSDFCLDLDRVIQI